MTKYMIQIDESDNVLVGNNKQNLLKAYKESVKVVYEAYLDCCNILGELPSITLSDLIAYGEIAPYDEWEIKTYKYNVEVIN